MYPAIFNAYRAAGWQLCRIEHQIKGPVYRGWQNAGITECPPENYGVGLLHAYSGTMALDIDRMEHATAWLAERGIDLAELFDAPNAVTIVSGSPNHGKLLYRLPVPLPSRKVMRLGSENILDFRCATVDGGTVQDCLPPHVHPSRRPYTWGGKGDWRALSKIPAPLLNVWLELLSVDDTRSVPIPDAAPTSREEILDALKHCDPDMSRQDWITVGMGLQSGLGDAGFELWNAWSAKGTKYHANEMRSQWKSFHQRPDGITVGSLFHIASRYGWRRPPPEVADLFSPLPDQDATQVISELSLTARLPLVNVELWPPVLARRAVELADEVGCDPIVPLMAGLAAMAAAVDARTTLQLTGSWTVPPTWWGMTIGAPADKKTPGSKPMFRVLRQIEVEDKDRFAVALLAWQGIEARHAADLKAFREWQASPEASMPGAVAPLVTVLTQAPAPLRLLIQDATTQKVVAMAASAPGGFLLYLDEMQKWLSRLADARHSDDRGCWIQGYETGPYAVDRVGSGTIMVENLALSMFGNCQPDVFRHSLASATTDGILQRFMPVVLNPVHNRMWRDSLPEFMSGEADYDCLVRRIHATPAFKYELAPDAMTAFKLFSAWSLRLRDAERQINSSAIYQTALGKLDGNCARLILLFHIILDPYTPVISLETVTRAIELFKTYFVQQLRYTYLEVGKQSDPSSRLIFDLIVQWAGSKPTVALAEIRTKLIKEGPARETWKTDQLIRATMEDLSTMGYVAMHQDHPRTPIWSINPTVAKVFDEHRRKIIKAKKVLLEGLKNDLAERGKHSQYREVVGYETED